MRGYLTFHPIPTRHPGSIPADAGLPLAARGKKVTGGVYPRGCGATAARIFAVLLVKGLSPRMRGYRHHAAQVHTEGGSIPADAGLPAAEEEASAPPGVYPRGCGATWRRWPPCVVVEGLSPRMRGYRIVQFRNRQLIGSIPADAGLPRAAARQRSRCGVYPRGCGATQRKHHEEEAKWGLSPRMRGYRAGAMGRRAAGGSIPADAGLPHTFICQGALGGVYPRGCGATPATVCQEPGATGPSLRISPRKDDSLSQGRTASPTKERHGPDATIILASGRRRCAVGTWDVVTAPCATPPKPPALVPATCRSS